MISPDDFPAPYFSGAVSSHQVLPDSARRSTSGHASSEPGPVGTPRVLREVLAVDRALPGCGNVLAIGPREPPGHSGTFDRSAAVAASVCSRKRMDTGTATR